MMTPKHRLTKERKRIKRKRKAEHLARMAYWERRGTKALCRAESQDPDKRALALLELASFKQRQKTGKPTQGHHRGGKR